MCDCELERDPTDPDDVEPMYYKRICLGCYRYWYSLHCPHDRHQRPCTHCGYLHDPLPYPPPVAPTTEVMR